MDEKITNIMQKATKDSESHPRLYTYKTNTLYMDICKYEAEKNSSRVRYVKNINKK